MTIIDLHPGMSISDAASSAPEGAVLLRLHPGVYSEKVFIRRSDVTVLGLGSSPDDVRIEWGDYAFEIMPDGIKRGTFRSYTFFIKGDRNSLKNLTVENTSHPGDNAGQAIALFAEGDFTGEKLVLKSYQDTLFTGPLPYKEKEPGGFRGPTELDERIPCKQYYRECSISGDIDFIFGSASCFFEDCDIISRNRLLHDGIAKAGHEHTGFACEPEVYGYCTAASTYDGLKYGYVFENCRFLNDGCPERSVYLGRPWREHARTVLINCYLAEHIKEEGFHDWGKTDAHESILYAEYASTGPGASGKRASFVRNLTEDEAKEYSHESFMMSALR
jgi:pectinesterase